MRGDSRACCCLDIARPPRSAQEPGHELMHDFFLTEEQIASASAAARASSPSPPPPRAQPTPTQQRESVDAWFAEVSRFLEAKGAAGARARGRYRFALTGGGAPSCWDVLIDEEGGGTVQRCDVAGSGTPDAEFTLSETNCLRMFDGSLRPTTAFMTGRLKIRGNLAVAMRAERLLAALRSRLHEHRR